MRNQKNILIAAVLALTVVVMTVASTVPVNALNSSNVIELGRKAGISLVMTVLDI